MVAATPYPACCGATVLSGFAGPEDRVIQEFLGCVVNSQNGHKLTFVLNQDQVNRYPGVLREAARVGFVLCAAWINQLHESYCYEFQRAGRRVSLIHAVALTNYPQVLLPDMGGVDNRDAAGVIPDQTADINRHVTLGGTPTWVRVGDYIRTTTPPGGVGAAEVPNGSIGRVTGVNQRGVTVRYIAGPNGYNRGREVSYTTERRECVRVEGGEHIGPPIYGLAVGDRFRVDSPRSRFHGQEHTVTRIVLGEYNRGNVIFFRADGDEQRLSSVSCIRLPGQLAPDPWRVVPFRNADAAADFIPPVTVIHRHGMEGLPDPAVPIIQHVEVPVPAPAPPAEIMYRTYHARYRDDRIGAGYYRLEYLRQANPRVTRYVEHQYWSDGRPHTRVEHGV